MTLLLLMTVWQHCATMKDSNSVGIDQDCL